MLKLKSIMGGGARILMTGESLSLFSEVFKMFELFGTNLSHQVEYLGTFRTERETQEVADDFKAMGYSKLKYCKYE